MSIQYWIASNGRFFSLTGTADAPICTEVSELFSPFSTPPNHCLLSPDFGQTFWCGIGRPSGGPFGCLLYSGDAGLTWTSHYDKMPKGNGDEFVLSMARNPETGTMCATYYEHNGFSGVAGGIVKYNPSTENWDLKQSTGANSATANILVQNGVWYCSVYAGATSKGIWRSLDDGETWSRDTSWSFVGWQGLGGCQLAVDSGDNFCCINTYLASGNWRCRERYGQFGAGPFTPTAVIPPDDWAFQPLNPRIQGRLMVWDPSDDSIWCCIDRNALTHVIRRDATSGEWSIEKVMSSASPFTMVIEHSESIWVATQAGSSHVSIYDGSAWHDYNYSTLNPNLHATTAIIGRDIEEGGGDLAGGPRFRVGFDPSRNSGPRQEDGSLQSDLQIVTGVQNVAQFDGGTLED